MKILDWLLIAAVAACVAAAVAYIVRQKKKGRCVGCGGDCAQCPYGQKKDKRP